LPEQQFHISCGFLPFFKTKLRDTGIRSYAGSFIFVMDKDRADLAAASALSLPGA